MTLPDGFSYVQGFLDLAEQEMLSQQIRALPYVHDRVRCRLMKRGYNQYGYTYVTTGRKLQTAPEFPGFLAALAAKAKADYPSDVTLNQVIVTHYPVGAGIGWHADAKCFGDAIVAVSLAGSAKLRFRPNGAKEHTHEVIVAPGSLYVLQGPARWNYQHAVVPVKTDRYSITFRHVPEMSI